MDDRVIQFRVGAFAAITLIFTSILVTMLGDLSRYSGRHYEIRARFAEVGGITRLAPIRINGVLIGRVTDVQLADDDESVLLTMEIDSDKTVYQNETPYITRDLMGNTAVAFIPSRVKGKRVPVEPGTIMKGEYSSDPTGLRRELKEPIDTVTNTGIALTKASEQLNAAAKRVELILNDKAQRDVANILNDAAQSMKVIQKMLGNEENQKKLADAVSKMPETLENMNRTFASTDEALRRFTEPSGPDRKTPIDRMVNTITMAEQSLRQFSEPTEPGQPAPVEQIAKAVGNINEITELMRNIMSSIDKGEGSLGALLKDRQLYNRLNTAAGRIERISRELRPIVDDASVLMDKAARHPGVFIRDAVKPGPGIK